MLKDKLSRPVRVFSSSADVHSLPYNSAHLHNQIRILNEDKLTMFLKVSVLRSRQAEICDITIFIKIYLSPLSILSVMKSSTRLNLSSPIYQSPIRTSKKSDNVRLPVGLSTNSFKGQLLLSQKSFRPEYSNIQNLYEERKICCPNCRYIFNLAVDEKILDVLTKQKMTQTQYSEKKVIVEERIDQQLSRTARQIGMKTRSVLLMEKLADISKSRIPKTSQQENQNYIEKTRQVRRTIPYQQLKFKEIQVLLRYTKDYLREDVPSYVKLMFQDGLLWQRPKSILPTT